MNRRLGIRRDPDTGERGELAQEVTPRRVLVRALIDRYDDLERLVRRSVEQAVETRLEKISPPRRRHDDAHAWRGRCYEEPDLLVVTDGEDVPRPADACEVLLDRSSRRVGGVRLRREPLRGHGPRDRPPVVEDVGHVNDPFAWDALGDPQREIPVLTAVEPLRKAADGTHQICPDHRQVAEVVLAEQEGRTPVGLEVVADPAPVDVDAVRVRVDEAHARVLQEWKHRQKQRVRSQQIVVVEQCDERASRQF